ncbi:nucleoid-associated protein [Oleiagrimonas sp. C23AA]|uniref:nucleoid-associated protein n=1 Tax=Oleiagrimonas sp. C23AA TaxID=2719047 RepID=UPI001422F349|nr:nucleoid-associated protein [Oleiagrimonas sp. C23AA]NII10983.1 nucleoid-associated protein [Oleiagrimonas sp. C23AA]
MGFLEQGKDALRIKAMSLHVVGNEEFAPEPELDEIAHEEFFLERIVENDADAIFSFTELSDVKSVIEKIIEDNLAFEAGAQRLAHDFAKAHVATSKEGAFFVIDLDTDDGSRFFCLIKYDYSEAVERHEVDGKTSLRKIIQAFVTDKKAVQKICLIRVKDGTVSTDVAARDRMKAAPELSDYFYKFLGVARERTDAQLTTAVLDVARRVLHEFKAHLGDRSVAIAMAEVEGALRLRETVDVDAMGEILLGVLGRPEDEKVHSSIERSIDRKFESAKLHGIGFKPDPAALATPKSVKLETEEGVVIKYSQRAGEALVIRAKKDNGGELITIDTDGAVKETITKVG